MSHLFHLLALPCHVCFPNVLSMSHSIFRFLQRRTTVNDTLLTVTGLKKSYGATQVLHDISFTLKKG